MCNVLSHWNLGISLLQSLRYPITLCLSTYTWPVWVLINQTSNLPKIKDVRLLFTASMWGGHGNSYSNVWQLDFKKCQRIDNHWKKPQIANVPRETTSLNLERILPTDLACLLCEVSTFHTWENWDLLYFTQYRPAYVCLLNFKSLFSTIPLLAGKKQTYCFLVPLT